MNFNKNPKCAPPKPSTTLAALTGAALALPAISQLAQAESAPTKTELGYHYSQYQEDDIDSTKILIGSKQRYDVDMHQFRLVTPLKSDLGLTVDASFESMSGASAYGVAAGAQGEPLMVMTGASIDDARTDVSANLRHYSDAGNSVAVVLGVSSEDDYIAYNGSIEGELNSQDRITTYSGGLGFSSDTFEPEQSAGINRPTSEDKHEINGYLALSRVLSPVWQTQFGFYAGIHDGYLSDPYRSRDIRPDQRQQFALSARSRYYLRGVNAALHADYRYYSDDWGIESHTLELAWLQNISDHLQLSPSLRYYSQSQADFYVATDSSDRAGYQSSDYRLSPFGAISFGLGIVLPYQHVKFSARLERYESSGDYALKNVDIENPALVSYSLISAGVDYRF